MAITVGDAVLKLGVDTRDLDKGFRGLKGKIQKHNKAIGLAMTAMGGAILAVGIKSVKTYAEMGDAVQKMALRTGFSTEALSELRHAAEISGADLATLEKGVKRMSMAILDANDGLAETVRAFEHIGVASEDLMGLSPEEQFFKIADGIASIEDPTLRAALAQKILGRAGTSLLPLFAEGAEGMKKLREEAHELGIVFDQEAANKAAMMTDAMARLKSSVSGVQVSIAEHLIPILIPLVDKIRETITNVIEWMKEHPKLTKVILIATGALAGLLLILGPLLIMLPGLSVAFGAFGAALHLALGPIGLIILGIAALVAAGILLWKNWEKVEHFFKDLWSNIKIIFAQAVKWLVKTVLQPFILYIDKWIGTIISVLGRIVGFFNKDWGDAIEDVARKLRNLDDDIVDWADSLIESERAVKANRDAQRDLRVETEAASEARIEDTKTIEGQTVALEDQTVALEDLSEELDNVALKANQAGDAFERMMDRIKHADSEAGEFNITMFDIFDALDELDWSVEAIRAVFDRYGTEIGSVNDALRGMGLTAKEVAILIGRLEGEVESITAIPPPTVLPPEGLTPERLAELTAQQAAAGAPLTSAAFKNQAELNAFIAATYAEQGMLWQPGVGVVPGAAGLTPAGLAQAQQTVEAQLAMAVSQGLTGPAAMATQQLAEIQAAMAGAAPAEHGGIAMKPMLVSVAEKRPEALIPLDKLEQMGIMGGKGTANITILLDGRVIAQAIGQPLVDEIRIRTGVKI